MLSCVKVMRGERLFLLFISFQRLVAFSCVATGLLKSALQHVAPITKNSVDIQPVPNGLMFGIH